MIQEKTATLVVATLTVKEFLCIWDEDEYFFGLNREPTQDDYESYLLHKATETYIGAPHESQIILSEV